MKLKQKRDNGTKKVTSLQRTFHFYYGSIGIKPNVTLTVYPSNSAIFGQN